MNRLKNFTDVFFLVVVNIIALAFILFVTRGNLNLFTADDNMKQWEPIIRAAYDYLFQTGEVAYIDFYQYNKLNIFDVGYYGLNNPLMFLAYSITYYIFNFAFDVIPTYIVVTVILGNIFTYLLLRKFNLPAIGAFTATLVYTSCPIFYLFANYYYSFNNYFFIPIFLYVLYSSYGKKVEYFLPGICLAFGISLGHAQYLAYYYMLYGIIEGVHFLVVRNKKTIVAFISNISLALMLSLPNIFILLEAAKRRKINIGTDAQFYSFPLDWKAFFINPFSFLERIDLLNLLDMMAYAFTYIYSGIIFYLFLAFMYFYVFKKLLVQIQLQPLSLPEAIFISILISSFCLWREYVIINIVSFNCLILLCTKTFYNKNIQALLLFMMCVFIPELLIITIIWLLIRNKRNNCIFECLIYGMILSTLFFILLSLGKNSVVACILHQLPIISNFRYLYKCLFIIFPLLYIITFCFMAYTNRKYFPILIFVFLFSALLNFAYIDHFMEFNHTFFNNFYHNLDMKEYKNSINRAINYANLDSKNYKLIGIHKTYDDERGTFWNDYQAGKAFPEYIAANYASQNEIFTIGGYDDCYSEYAKKQTENIHNNHLSNIMLPNDLYFIKKNNIIPFFNQIDENAIKYFLFDKTDKEAINLFETLLANAKNHRIIKKAPFAKDSIIYEISIPNAIVSSDLRNKIDLSPMIAKLSFDKIKGEKFIRLAFSYDEHYQATMCTTENCTEVKIIPDNKKYTILVFNDTQQAKFGTITLKYKNYLCDLTVLFSIMNFFLLVLIICSMKGDSYEK